MPNYDRIKQIRSFESLVAYLHTELDWPVKVDSFEDVEDYAFEWDAEELGLDENAAVKIRAIKQLRPLTQDQPWGVFYLDFESKRLPVVVLRKILRGLVPKKRKGSSALATWSLNDLLFISAVGEEEHRGISFAHFKDSGNGTPILQTFSWDDRETHFHYIQNLNLERLRWPANADQWREQWAGAFTAAHRESIGTSEELSRELAKLARNTRDLVLDIYQYESKKGPLHSLHKSFRTVLIHDLDENRFADYVAQTIAYGLFTARAEDEQKTLSLKHLESMVPNTNPFLKDLFSEFAKLSGHSRGQIDFDELGVSHLIDLLNAANMEAIKADFGRQSNQGREDPVVHFYERFLKEYDKEQKVKRGVFYTPKPVVSFIVKSVHKILREEFGLQYGLADTTTWGEMAARTEEDWRRLCHSEHSEESAFQPVQVPAGVSPESPFVQILDPATGTGTFLETVIEIIHDTMVEKWREEGKDKDEIRAEWNEYVPKHLLPRLYGFELMMAPYAVAHLKLGLKLKETGYDFRAQSRLQVYLTNTLEQPEISQRLPGIVEAIAHEAQAVNEIKRKQRFTVVVGNPPYSNYGRQNRNDWILGLLRDYKQGLQEKKLNLDDDYIKFMSLAQHTIETTGIGIVGLITNNSYLDGITHRRMRESLMGSFRAATLVNLHGSAKKQERSPDGSDDENVFDIQQGVGIALLRKVPAGNSELRYVDVWGSRDGKYEQLRQGLDNIPLVPAPASPQFALVPARGLDEPAYHLWPSLRSAFSLCQNGISTDRDALFFDFDAGLLEQRIRTLLSGNWRSTFVQEFNVRASSSYDLPARIRGRSFKEQFIRFCAARPFDTRLIYYDPSIISRPASSVMQHVDAHNVLLLTIRNSRREQSGHFFATRLLVGKDAVSPFDHCFVFPLYTVRSAASRDGATQGDQRSVPDDLFDTQEHLPLAGSSESRTANLSKEFIKNLCGRLKLAWRKIGKGDLTAAVGPEDVFNYIYAIVHSPSYRSRYAAFLKIDFPRIPLTSDKELFRSLCKLGGELVGLHLMEKHGPIITTYPVNGDNVVESVRYTEPGQGSAQGRVWINKTQYFEGVPPEVWEFHIGGYQVCEKWLKDRGPKKGQPGRTLSDDDIGHYQRIVAALNETIRLMAEIDAAVESHGGWPLPGSVPETANE